MYWHRASTTLQMLNGANVYLLLYFNPSPSPLQIIAGGFALLKFCRPCARWLRAARTSSPDPSAAATEAGAGGTSAGSAPFPEPPTTRNSVHMDQATPQMEEVFAGMKRGRRGEKNMRTYLKKKQKSLWSSFGEFPVKHQSLIFQIMLRDQKLKTRWTVAANIIAVQKFQDWDLVGSTNQ